MSIMKAYRNDLATRDADEILTSFQRVFENAMEKEMFDRGDVVALVSFYAEYGVAYLRQVAYTFHAPEQIQTTMKFMNSVIAEAVNEAGLHYYNREQGFSIIDKAVQEALDNGGLVTPEQINIIIDEIEVDYIQAEAEELEVEH